MSRILLSGTDLRVSRICLGTWQFNDGFGEDVTWQPQSYETSKEIVNKAFDCGINFFDTAEAYRNSENVLGRCLEGRRHEAIIASKVGYRGGKAVYTVDDMLTSLDLSLKSLKTDYVDLYQVHWPTVFGDDDNARKMIDELNRQVSLGRIKHWGVCNAGRSDLERIFNIGGKPVSNQLLYNLLARGIEFEAQPECVSRDLSILAYSPLQQGLLTGKFKCADDVPAGRKRTRHFSPSASKHSRHGDTGIEKQTFEAIDAIRKECGAAGISMVQASLGWILNRPSITNVIIGAARPSQLEAAVDTVDLQQDFLDRLTVITEEVKEALGPNCDLWADKNQPRMK